MTIENVKKIEERINVLEFKLELVLKLTKNDLDLTLETCKTMTEFAFVMGLQKTEFVAINEILSTQINFFKGYKQNVYISPRQYPKFEEELDVFTALSTEEFENEIWKILSKYEGNKDVCKKIAKINGIYDMYYDQLALDIKNAKHERLDKETKLLVSYQENKEQVDNLFNEVKLMQQILQSNLQKTDSIIDFFDKNSLIKISIFYNGELWDRDNDDKQVVINEDTYIHNVCSTDKREILNQISELLKDKKHEYKDLLVYLLASGPTSSKKIENLQDLYNTMDVYNKNEYVQKDEIIILKQKIETNLKIADEILAAYQDYKSNI